MGKRIEETTLSHLKTDFFKVVPYSDINIHIHAEQIYLKPENKILCHLQHPCT
jgi:hypothetical protein